MTFTRDKQGEFVALSRSLMRWLKDNCHPHYTVIIDSEHAELVEGHMVVRNPLGLLEELVEGQMEVKAPAETSEAQS